MLYKFIKYLTIFLAFTLFSISFNSCIIVKYDNDEEIEVEQEIDISPKPILELSNNMIRSEKGDMIAFLPKDWFLVDVEGKISTDVMYMAVNKEYNLGLVVASIPKVNEYSKKINDEGLYALAWYSFMKKEKKSAGNIKQIGKYQPIKMGPRKFVQYEYVGGNAAAATKTIVFASTIGEFYEMTLIPMVVDSNPIPKQQEINDIFQSILAGIKF
ncbi:MAG TPA: hypothetical protein PLE30_10700 [Candidatus Kapabacteria bacterium]|nr:hypothetical protein [Candidatus Kapabacteria bacterium]